MLKTIFLTIAMLLIASALVNAEVEDEFDFSKLNSTNLYKINWTSSNLEIDLYLNMSYVGYNQACRHENEPAAPSMWTLSNGGEVTDRYTFDEYTYAIRTPQSNGKATCSLGDGVLTGFMLNKKYNNQGSSGQGYLGITDDATYTISTGFIGNQNLIRNGVGNTNIKVADDNTTFVYVMLDTVKGFEYARNFSGTGGEAGKSEERATGNVATPTKWRVDSNSGSMDVIMFRIRGWLDGAAKNLSLNVFEYYPNMTTTGSALIVNVTAGKGDEVRVNISCDNRVTWTYGAVNETITCSAGSTNKPIVRLQLNNTDGAGNITNIKISAGAVAPPADTNPTNITLINLTSEASAGSLGQIVYNNTNEDIGKLTALAKTNDTTPTYRINTSESATCAIYASPRLNLSDSSNVLLMTFDENASDLSNHNQKVNIIGATHSNGKIGKAYSFDGIDDYINISSEAASLRITNTVSVSLWVKNPKNNGRLIIVKESNGDNGDYWIDIQPNGTPRCVANGGVGVVSTPFIASNNTWIHMALTYQLNELKCYVNGEFGGTDTSLAAPTGSTQPIMIGGGYPFDSHTNFFNGTIDEVAVFNKILSQEEISNIYKYGLSPNMNYSMMVKQVPERVCSTTGGTAHTCTLPTNDTLTLEENLRKESNGELKGISSVFFGCKDTTGNEYSYSTPTDDGLTGMSYVNITDAKAPNSTLFRPKIDEFFVVGVNTSNINFTFFGIDSIDRNFTAELLIDESVQITNSTYLNGTNVTYIINYATIGRHNWSVRMTDSFNNINYSGNRSFSIQQAAGVSVFLNGLGDTRKYEYRSTANISANCTEAFGGDCGVCLTLTEPRYLDNYTCGTNQVSMLVNLSQLRIYNFSHGPSSAVLSASSVLNVTNNNLSIIDRVSLNITNSGETTNLNITYYGRSKKLLGTLKTKYLENNRFIHNNIEKDAVNLTLLSGSSDFIFSNLTDVDNPINMTFDISGSSLDANNQFSYIEYFNKTPESKGINETLTFQSDSPIGIFDAFTVNVSGRWGITLGVNGVCPIFRYTANTVGYGGTSGNHLFASCDSGGASSVDYSDSSADLRNSSRIENELFWVYRGAPEDALFQIMATDGTSTITLIDHQTNLGEQNYNYTFIKSSSNYKTWQVFENGSSSGTFDLSALDFNNQIKLQWRIRGGNDLRLYNVKWSGAWLNYSINNGTYRPIGNVTSKLIQNTTNNVSKATLTAVEYKPSGTSINYFLSNNCNATKPTFEPVTSGITHTFVTTGNYICWRANMSSNTNTTSPVIRFVTISVTKASIENVSVDLGNDGTDEQTFTGVLNSTTGPFKVNLTPTAGILNTIKISADTAGLIQINNFKLNSSVNPVNLNKTNFENCHNCSINFTFGGDSITVNALEFEILGSLNYTATANSSTFKESKIIQIFYSLFNVSIASKKYGFYDVFATSQNHTNLTPYTQSDSTPIWNVTNLAYDEPINIYARTNFTPSCLNVTYSNYSNRSYVNSLNFTLNGTYKLILENISVSGKLNFTQINETFNITLNMTSGINSSLINYSIIRNQSEVRNITPPFTQLKEGIDFRIDYENKNFTLINSSFNRTGLYLSYNYTHNIENSKGIWNWWDLYSCGNRFEIPYVFFSGICKNCYFDRTQLDDFNVITE